MKYFITILLCIGSAMAFAQRGPGGFSSARKNTDLVLWLDASQLTTYFADQTMSTWTDFSGDGHDATQAISSQQPTYKAGLLNSKAVVSFLQTNDSELGGSIANSGGQFNAPATIVSLVKFDKASQTNSSDNDYVISIGSEGPVGSNTGGEMTAVARRRNANGNQDKYYTYDGTDVDISDAAVLDDNSNWFIIVQILRDTNSPDPYHEAYVDGSQVVYTTNNYAGPFASNGAYSVATWTLDSDFPTTDYYLDGDIAEIMVFNRELNLSELRVIHAYLVAKWNGDAATDIDISAADTFTDLYAGDLTAQGHYDEDLIGVGQTSSTDVLSTASDAGLKLTTASNYGDGDFLMAAHNVASNDLSTDGLTGDDERWSRVWYLDMTDAGSAARTTFTFDISESGLGGNFSGNATNYDILYKETSGGSWTFLNAASTYVDDELQFASLDLSGNGSANGDGYYTLATKDKSLSSLGIVQTSLGDKGPGGIEDTDGTTNLALWLDPNELVAVDGAALAGWTDKSGNGASPSQSGTTRQPVYDTNNSPNGVHTLLFDGTNDYLSGNLASNPSAPLTLVAVANFGSLNQSDGEFDNDYIVSIGSTGSSNTEHLGIARRKDENGAGQNQNNYYSWTGLQTSFGPAITGQEWTFISATHNTTTQRHEVYFDGVKQTSPSPDYTAGSISATASSFDIGRWLGANNYMNGEIAEVILFDEVLNKAKLNILHSYLSAKYEIGFTISDGDRYIGDCSAIVAMTDCSVAHNYDLEVAGIGTDGAGGSEVSHTSASSAGLNMAMTSSETSDSGVNDTFSGDDYLIFGHNQRENAAITTDIGTTTSAIEGRTQRDWFVDVTESDATGMKVDVTFDFSEMGLPAFPAGTASNYKLLFRTTNTVDTDWTIVDGASSITGDQVVFNDISFTQDGFIALGTISEVNSPLPVKLLTFSAMADEQEVALFWSTADESGNQGFVIQRSSNGLSFEDLLFVAGEGDTDGLTEYRINDPKPLDGNNYYRLRQVDFNGNSSLSEVVRVHIDERPIVPIAMYPNPASTTIHVEVQPLEEPGRLLIRDGQGRPVMDRPLTNQRLELDVSRLPDGMYLLEARWQGHVETRKLLIRK